MHLRSFGKGAELKNTTKNPLLYLAWRRVSGGIFQTKHSVYHSLSHSIACILQTANIIRNTPFSHTLKLYKYLLFFTFEHFFRFVFP